MKKLLSIFISLVLLFGITTIGISVKAADYTYGDWSYTVSNSKATITKYSGSATNIELPKKVAGYSANEISGSFLKGNDTIISVVIPEGYTTINDGAFRGCAKLVSVSIPKSMENIGLSNISSCFADCPELETVTFASGGTKEASIGPFSFKNCPKIVSVTIPSNYKDLGGNVFENCTSLKKLTINKGLEGRTIGNSAFKNCDELLKVEIPEGFVLINDGAFRGCAKLVSVSIPKSMENIGLSNISSCFADCPELETVTFASGGTKEASIGPFSFENCPKISEVVIPANYTDIGSDVFSGCTSLETIIISENQYSSNERVVSSWCFRNNKNLKSIHIPVGVSSIGEKTLSGSTANFTICSTSADSVAKQFADDNGYKFVVCDGKHAYENETTFILTYNANGGTGAPAKQSGERSYTISSIKPTRSGYTFLGWAKNSQALSASYVAGEKINLSTDLTLYAVWSKNSIGGEEEKDGASVKANDLLLNYKENSKISVEVTGTDNYVIVYESSNPEIVSVNKDGNVTAVGTGTAEITVTVTDEYGNIVEDTCTVTVNMAWWQWIIIIVLFGWIWY